MRRFTKLLALLAPILTPAPVVAQDCISQLLTNHFTPLAVHANTADPMSGQFFGDMRRRFLADFDVVF